MDFEAQLKVQAYLDGELSPAEARQVEDRLAREPEAQALLVELKMTVGALDGAEPELKLPESREFYWSKIQREIQREMRPAERSPLHAAWVGWRRWLTPASALAGVLAIALLTARGHHGPLVEATLSDSGAFTYRDYSAKTTLVWFSYPADNEVAEADPVDIFE
jgi:anti-sigma factor RsiW